MCLGIPGRVVAIADDGADRGVVDVSGVRREVNLSLVREEGIPATALIGRWVLIHVGFAMSCIDEDEAQRTLSLLRELGEVEREAQGPAQQGEP